MKDLCESSKPSEAYFRNTLPKSVWRVGHWRALRILSFVRQWCCFEEVAWMGRLEEMKLELESVCDWMTEPVSRGWTLHAVSSLRLSLDPQRQFNSMLSFNHPFQRPFARSTRRSDRLLPSVANGSKSSRYSVGRIWDSPEISDAEVLA